MTIGRFIDEIVRPSKVRVLGLLNIAGSGMDSYAEQDTSQFQVEPLAEAIKEYGRHIVGIKTAHYKGGDWESIDRAVRAAERADVIVMVDYQNHPNRSYRELLLNHMRPGDLHTHMYAQHIAQIDDHDKVHDYVFDARKRGVLFDLGHGAGSFWFRIAKPCLDQGHLPDTISTDVHQGSYYLPRPTMPNAISKLVNLGMSLAEAVARSTAAPARAIRRPGLGSLSLGAEADIGIFELEEGEFGFVDSGIARMTGSRRLTCELTIRKGNIVFDLNGRSTSDFRKLGRYIRADRPSDPGIPREMPKAR